MFLYKLTCDFFNCSSLWQAWRKSARACCSSSKIFGPLCLLFGFIAHLWIDVSPVGIENLMLKQQKTGKKCAERGWNEQYILYDQYFNKSTKIVRLKKPDLKDFTITFTCICVQHKKSLTAWNESSVQIFILYNSFPNILIFLSQA